VRPDDLAMEDLLLLEDGHCMRDHALAACALEGAQVDSARACRICSPVSDINKGAHGAPIPLR